MSACVCAVCSLLLCQCELRLLRLYLEKLNQVAGNQLLQRSLERAEASRRQAENELARMLAPVRPRKRRRDAQ